MPRKKPHVAPAAPPLTSTKHETEVEAYDYIRRQLRELGWAVRNPSLGTGGHVWTQNQCLSHPAIKSALGTTRPENIVRLTEHYLWVIESKAARKDIDLAVHEAQNDYAKPINDLSGDVEALLTSGVAGDEASGYAVRTFIRLDERWRQVTINGQEATGLLSPDDVRVLLEGGTSDIHEFAPPQWLFLSAAERINKILHQGGINKETRARTIAALLLSVVDQPPNLDTELLVLIEEINARSKSILTKNGKQEFAPFVHILPPTNSNNHFKFQAALVKTIQELLNLNIRSAMNSSTDVLGEFYEVFLKYGNGAKEIGIVLTPRHITRFAVQAVGVGPTDVVLDPACGTGGFLVAAFDHIRQTGTPSQLDRFKQRNLFGIEQESYVAVLAIVNMIFRGDGKNNIIEGNCFTTNLIAKSKDGYPSAAYVKEAPKLGTQAVTRVLMNPPFAVPGSQDKEYKFVSRALELMVDGGILFSLLPMDSMFGANEEKVWRETELLPHHTLLSVISLPDELFYPAALKQVVAVIIRKGFPHPKQQAVFWARIDEDGHLKVKTRRLEASEMRPPRMANDDIPQVLPHLRSFVNNPSGTSVNEPMLCKTAAINFDDPLLELLPEAYLDSAIPTHAELEAEIDRMARETAAQLIRFGTERLAGAFDGNNS
jgi:type I restriction enzyme M protein